MPWMYSKTASTNPRCALCLFSAVEVDFRVAASVTSRLADNPNQSDKSKLPIKKKQEQNKNNGVEKSADHVDQCYGC